MIHTKSLIRRLAYVPWLLAFGLVVGWTGEAQANITEVKLGGLAKISVREDAGEQKIAVSVKRNNKGAAASVTLRVSEIGLSKRFLITLPALVIAKGADAQSGEIVFTPIQDNKRGSDLRNDADGGRCLDAAGGEAARDATPTPTICTDASDDLTITITANDGGGPGSATILLLDDDKLSSELNLSFDPASLKKDAGDSDVEVTASLDGSLLGDTYEFPLAFRNTLGSLEKQDEEGTPDGDEILRRDSHYAASSATLRLRKQRVSGSKDISIEPKGKDGFIAIELTVSPDDRAKIDGKVLASDGDEEAYAILARGVDLNFDGETNKKFALVPYYSTTKVPVSATLNEWNEAEDRVAESADADADELIKEKAEMVPVPDINRGRLTEKVLSGGEVSGDDVVDISGDGRSVGYTGDAEEVPQYVTEAQLGIDLNGDGDMADGGVTDPTPTPTTEVVVGDTFDADDPDAVNSRTAAKKFADAIQESVNRIDMALNEDPETDGATSAIYWPPYPDFKPPDNDDDAEHRNAENPLVLDEDLLEFAVIVNPGFVEITEAAFAAVVKGAGGLKVTPAVIRENDGRQELEVVVTLANKLKDPSSVSFEVIEGDGIRDQDYVVTIEDLIVPADTTKWTGMLVLIPTDNEDSDGEKNFTLTAAIGEEGEDGGSFEIRIVDDESVTTEIGLSTDLKEVKVGTGKNVITVTAKLNGMVFTDEDVKVTLVLAPKGVEGRDGAARYRL